MDKQKQIEEMAKVLAVNCGECYTCKYLDKLHCADLLSAEALYEAGYRKIPENAVVLTMEEYDEIKQIKEMTAEQVIESEELKKSIADAVNSFVRLETLYKIKCKELEIANKKLEELKGGKVD